MTGRVGMVFHMANESEERDPLVLLSNPLSPFFTSSTEAKSAEHGSIVVTQYVIAFVTEVQNFAEYPTANVDLVTGIVSLPERTID